MANWDTVSAPSGINWSIPVHKDNDTVRLEALLLNALNTKVNKKYKPEIRISKLPMCGLLHAMELINYSNGKIEEELLADSFYTDIGTACHNFWQGLLPRSDSKSQVFGDWKCEDCKKIVAERCTTPKSLICPHCKKNNETVKYEEISLNYRGVTGHVDMLFKNADGTYTIIDFKTTSAYSIQQPKYLPYPKHLMQIQAYIFMLQHQYKIKISYYSIVYISRDKNDSGKSLKNMRTFGKKVTTRMIERRQEQLDQIIYSRGLIKKLFKDPTLETLKLLDDNRPCHKLHDYENSQTGMQNAFFGEEHCPFMANCCNGKDKKYTKAARELWRMLDE